MENLVMKEMKGHLAHAQGESHYGVVIEDDPEQVAFGQVVEDWVEGRTTFDAVIEKVPQRTPTFGEVIRELFTCK
jgi:hypothetical protein